MKTSLHLFLINLHFPLFLLIGIAQFPLSIHGCHEYERKALLDFKLPLSDPSNRLSSWQQGSQHQNCCRWHGIECSHDSFHVISIDLRNKDVETFEYDVGVPPKNTTLYGKLSPSLFNITHLEYLDLALNDFQESQIPLQLSHLTKLTHLDLSDSNFAASISTQFTNLTSLRYLDLSCSGALFYNSISCMDLLSTKWIRGLENLKVLNLRGINLSKATYSQKNFAEHISYLSNLDQLDISACSISTAIFPILDVHNLSRLSFLDMNSNPKLSSEIPVWMLNITSLSILDLFDCGLQGSVPYLPQLKWLDVSNNLGIRPDLTRIFQHQWPNLQTLSISYTSVSGSIPASISNAPLLVSLSAYECSIQGSLPSSIYNLARLRSLELGGNNITGYIHSSISNLKFLKVLDLSRNNFQGSLPNSVCNIFPLQLLHLDDNNITGTLPSCLVKLQNLSSFSVSGNSIGGTVSLINFVNEFNLISLDLGSNRLNVVIDQRFHLYSKFKLEHLNLRSCNMKGLFPTFICKFTHLQYLDLSQNHLAGVIPYYCFSKLQIGLFNLSNNIFHGPLPVPHEGTSSLPFFDLSNNKLSGDISADIGKRLSSFLTINLAGNELSGPIPVSIFSKDSVDSSVDIDLSNNKFSGSIPFSICSKDSTINHRTIDLSNNKLSGIIPSSIGYCTDLLSLNLGTNNLTGNVPNELQQLKSLSSLQLNNNNLEGTPLNFISKLHELQLLNLANNNFGGSIPTTIGSAFGLSFLSLRSNKLNGSIPQEINHLERLQILDLSQNKLSGHIPKISGKYWMGLISISSDYYFGDDVQLQMVIKGIMVQFEKLYNYSSGIDLSCNMLDGNIPVEIGLLKRIATLNLSHNDFSNDIPESVGSMSSLGSLDLSFNRLSGHIPKSLTSLDSLGILNLSYNELSGRIPRGDHFDTLGVDGWAYVGNDLLCGEPSKKLCDGDTKHKDAVKEDDEEKAKERILFYGVIALGFGVGFWGLFIVLFLRKQKWWFPYWIFVDSVAVRIVGCIHR